MIGRAIRLENLHNLMDVLPLDQIHVMAYGQPPIGIHEVYYVDVLNQLFANYYGEKTDVVANIYTGANSEKHTFHFPLAQGTDLFSKDGHLQHDWLIARWIQPDARGLTPGKEGCTPL